MTNRGEQINRTIVASPSALVRMPGDIITKTFGTLVRGAVREVLIGRLRITDEHEANLLFDYFWGLLTAQPLSADKTVNVLLEPLLGVGYPFYARRPVADEPVERLATLPPLMASATCHAQIAPRSRPDRAEIAPRSRRSNVAGCTQ